MKPWPEEISKIYPLPPFTPYVCSIGRCLARHPTRPWWEWISLDGEVLIGGKLVENKTTKVRLGWRRKPDDLFVFVGAFDAMAMLLRQIHEKPEMPLEPRDPEKVDAVDAERPLPHPGFRLGQIWASTSGQSVQVILLSGGRPMVKDYVTHKSDQESPWSYASLMTIDLPSHYEHLVHDPACPWLAPWSPAPKAAP
jgi:hypothetical protein